MEGTISPIIGEISFLSAVFTDELGVPFVTNLGEYLTEA